MSWPPRSADLRPSPVPREESAQPNEAARNIELNVASAAVFHRWLRAVVSGRQPLLSEPLIVNYSLDIRDQSGLDNRTPYGNGAGGVWPAICQAYTVITRITDVESTGGHKVKQRGPSLLGFSGEEAALWVSTSDESQWREFDFSEIFSKARKRSRICGNIAEYLQCLCGRERQMVRAMTRPSPTD